MKSESYEQLYRKKLMKATLSHLGHVSWRYKKALIVAMKVLFLQTY